MTAACISPRVLEAASSAPFHFHTSKRGMKPTRRKPVVKIPTWLKLVTLVALSVGYALFIAWLAVPPDSPPPELRLEMAKP